MNTKTMCVGFALIAGVLIQARPARADVCSDENFLSGLCALTDELLSIHIGSSDAGPRDAGADAGAAPTATPDAGPFDLDDGNVTSALTPGQKPSSPTNIATGSSQDPTAAPSGETPATADQGEIGGGGGCTTGRTHSAEGFAGLSTSTAAGAIALGVLASRRRRRR